MAVHLKNSRHKYRGRTYDGVPAASPVSRNPDVTWLVTLGIGTPELFPTDNIVQTVRWAPVRGEPAPHDVLRRDLSDLRPRGFAGPRSSRRVARR